MVIGLLIFIILIIEMVIILT